MLIIEDISHPDKELLVALLVREIAQLEIKQSLHGRSTDIDYAIKNLKTVFDKVMAAKP